MCIDRQSSQTPADASEKPRCANTCGRAATCKTAAELRKAEEADAAYAADEPVVVLVNKASFMAQVADDADVPKVAPAEVPAPASQDASACPDASSAAWNALEMTPPGTGMSILRGYERIRSVLAPAVEAERGAPAWEMSVVGGEGMAGANGQAPYRLPQDFSWEDPPEHVLFVAGPSGSPKSLLSRLTPEELDALFAWSEGAQVQTLGRAVNLMDWPGWQAVNVRIFKK